MKRNSRNLKISASALAVAGLAMQSNAAVAAGFEKSLFWSASSASQGGAVVGSVKGADALFFNPAGLAASGATSTEVSINFSPTFSKFHGTNPLHGAGSIDGKSGFSPVGAALVSHKLTDKAGLGFGYYVSGGSKAKYEGLDYSSTDPAALAPLFAAGNISPTVETNLAVTEFSLGGAYEVAPGLRIGAAWRPTMVAADFSTVSAGANPAPLPAGQYVANVHIRDISKTRWNGYRVGVQYEAPEKNWGVGVSYRSEITFTAEGDQTSDVSATSGATPSPTVSAGLKNALTGKSSISNLFPQQANLGGFFKASETLKVALEYSFTNYSKNKGLTIDGPGAGPASVIVQNWKNQHIGRVGFEYTGTAMPIRAGYAITSQVTPSDRARSTFASPGKGHAIALGSSYPLMANLDLDFAGEYSFAKGKGNNDPEVASEAEFKSRGMVGHLSAKYRF